MQDNLADDDIPQITQRLWTSNLALRGADGAELEFCSILNTVVSPPRPALSCPSPAPLPSAFRRLSRLRHDAQQLLLSVCSGPGGSRRPCTTLGSRHARVSRLRRAAELEEAGDDLIRAVLRCRINQNSVTTRSSHAAMTAVSRLAAARRARVAVQAVHPPDNVCCAS